jgi:hypothetical protein
VPIFVDYGVNAENRRRLRCQYRGHYGFGILGYQILQFPTSLDAAPGLLPTELLSAGAWQKDMKSFNACAPAKWPANHDALMVLPAHRHAIVGAW